jgi:hypothetical protein
MAPMAMVRPAVKIEAMAMRDWGSMVLLPVVALCGRRTK